MPLEGILELFIYNFQKTSAAGASGRQQLNQGSFDAGQALGVISSFASKFSLCDSE